MNGETDLHKLLQNIKPERNPGEYVFCPVDSYEHTVRLQPLCMFREKEGYTVILPRQQADQEELDYSVVLAWITLIVHSSLEAVGLTAAVSKALAGANIIRIINKTLTLNPLRFQPVLVGRVAPNDCRGAYRDYVFSSIQVFESKVWSRYGGRTPPTRPTGYLELFS